MHNYWIAVSDLLSGFVVVCLLLFVSASISSQIAEGLRQMATEDLEQKLEEIKELKEKQAELESKRERQFEHLREILMNAEAEDLVIVDPKAQTIELKDISFQSGSACLSPDAISVLNLLQPQIMQDMNQNPELNIYIEGHTDPEPVASERRSCGLFDNNIQLSTLRASNVREIFEKTIPDAKVRMPVTGWGAARLKDKENERSSVNRRVELRWVWNGL